MVFFEVAYVILASNFVLFGYTYDNEFETKKNTI